MNINYSIRAKFSGGGIGSIAYHAVKGIHRHNYLQNLFVPLLKPSDIPDDLIKKIPVDAPKRIKGVRRIYPDYIEDNLFDFLVSKKLAKSDIFHGWNHHCLFSLRRAKELGAVTVVERASSHILTQNELLQEEYKRWGVRKKPIHPLVIKKCLAEFEEADYITVPSPFVYDSMVERGIPEKKLILVPFGVTIEKFKSQNSKLKTTSQISKPNSAGKFIALFVGEVGLRKGVPYLLQAWAELNLKNAELWLAGAINSDIKRRVLSKYRNRKDIKCLGFKTNVPELMAKADIFVFPSIEEGSALVTYEAMAAGLPVVTTVNSGSVVGDGQEGFVLPIRDVEALKEKIKLLFLYNGKGLREEMGERARQRVQEFTWYQYGENLVKAYEKILG